MPKSKPVLRLRMRAICFLMLILAACGGDAPSSGDAPKPTLRVAAAASMTDVVNKLGDAFEGAKVSGNFGASGDLARQIKDGAPADIYISAAKSWADFMAQEGLNDGDVLVFALNGLVCVAPADSGTDIKSLKDLPGAGLRFIAIGDEGVPAGNYTREAMRHFGVYDALRPSLVGQKDVRAALKAVEAGEADCGFVYSTDANVAKVRTLFIVDPASHARIEYYVCVVKQAEQPAAAKAFIEHLKSERGRAILREAGFLIPDAD
jgi:molybdate transport system substrate-binding protein